MLSKGNQILLTFVIPFYFGSGTEINYGSGSAKVCNQITAMVLVLLRQKVKVPTVPVPVQQHWTAGGFVASVADPGCLSRILIFTHPGSRISDPGTKNNN
jgi:hypothetical protein